MTYKLLLLISVTKSFIWRGFNSVWMYSVEILNIRVVLLKYMISHSSRVKEQGVASLLIAVYWFIFTPQTAASVTILTLQRAFHPPQPTNCTGLVVFSPHYLMNWIRWPHTVNNTMIWMTTRSKCVWGSVICSSLVLQTLQVFKLMIIYRV